MADRGEEVDRVAAVQHVGTEGEPDEAFRAD
jgi:hypothetical protein